jgi:hypothetical protein
MCVCVFFSSSWIYYFIFLFNNSSCSQKQSIGEANFSLD